MGSMHDSGAPSPWRVYDQVLASRFLIGSAGYPSPAVLERAIEASGAQVVTVGLKLHRRRTFGWLVASQGNALAAAIFLFSVLPTHWIGARANVAPVLRHEYQPLVHVEEQAREPESAATLLPLVYHDDERIRRGMAALLLDERDRLRRRADGPLRVENLVVVHARRRLEEASADLYADRWTTFRRVTLPLIFPGVFSGAMLAFLISMDDFITSNMLSSGGTTTLPIYIFSLIRSGTSPELNAIATLLILASLLLATAALAMAARGTRDTA